MPMTSPTVPAEPPLGDVCIIIRMGWLVIKAADFLSEKGPLRIQTILKRTAPRNGGRGDWIRTSDLHTPSVMRYQAALRPDGWRI